MKKFKRKNYLICFFLIIILIISCNADRSVIEENTVKSGFSEGIAILNIDGCEYVWVKRGYGAGLTHKGNCNNPEHVCKCN